MLRTRPRRLAFGFVLAILAIGATFWWLSVASPRWYRPAEADDPAANELAALVEQRLAEEVHKIRENAEPWQVRIREEQVNVWFATRLPKWLEHERGTKWPDRLGTPQVRFDSDQFSIAVPATIASSSNPGRGSQRTITITLAPRLEEDELRFTLIGIRIGRLGTPGEPMNYLERLFDLHAPDRHGSAEEADDRGALAAYLIELASGETGLDPTVKLVDDRRVTLTALHLGRGVMDITMRTNPPVRSGVDAGSMSSSVP